MWGGLAGCVPGFDLYVGRASRVRQQEHPWLPDIARLAEQIADLQRVISETVHRHEGSRNHRGADKVEAGDAKLPEDLL